MIKTLNIDFGTVVRDHGDDYGLRFERTQSSTVVVYRNWGHFAPATDALQIDAFVTFK